MSTDIEAIRRANLKHLIDEQTQGNVTLFARRHGLQQPMVNRYVTVGLDSSAPMGPRAARNYEQRLGLAPFALDKPLPGVVIRTYAYETVGAVLGNSMLAADVVAELISRAVACSRAAQLRAALSLLFTEPSNPAYKRLVADEVVACSNAIKVEKNASNVDQDVVN